VYWLELSLISNPEFPMGIRWQPPYKAKPVKNIEKGKHICGGCKNR
jgi:hypothetical protein